MAEDEAKLQSHLAVEIEVLERKLNLWAERGFGSHQRFREAVERKQLLQRELDLSRLRQMETHEAGSKPREIGFSPAGREQSPELVHTPDYTSVNIGGKPYSLTSRQAQMIEILHAAWKEGTPDVGIAFILEKLGTENSRWQDTWKRNPQARRSLIRNGNRKGTLRLNL
jgi:hypothetical protein